MTISAPEPARSGYYVIPKRSGAHREPRPTLEAVARRLFIARANGEQIEVVARTTLTRERPLTDRETLAIVAHATAIREEVAA